MGNCNNSSDNNVDQQFISKEPVQIINEQENEKENNQESEQIISKKQVAVKSETQQIEENEGEIQHNPSKQDAVLLEEQIENLNQTVQETLNKLGPYKYHFPQFDNDQTVTLGKYKILKDDSIYEGQWHLGLKQGRGKQVFSDGSLYEGYWKDNCMHGQGRMINVNGDAYDGEWENNRPTGQGQYFQRDNGAQEAIKITPIPSLIHKEGPSSKAKPLDQEPDYLSYEAKQQINKLGQYAFNHPECEVSDTHELGPYQVSEEAVYIGNWKNKMKNGRGKEIWKDGSVYVGYWRDDKKNGFGRMIYNNGDVFDGEWIDDRPAQRGQFIQQNDAASYAAQFFQCKFQQSQETIIK